jgi:hypothetical protein
MATPQRDPKSKRPVQVSRRRVVRIYCLVWSLCGDHYILVKGGMAAGKGNASIRTRDDTKWRLQFFHEIRLSLLVGCDYRDYRNFFR